MSLVSTIRPGEDQCQGAQGLLMDPQWGGSEIANPVIPICLESARASSKVEVIRERIRNGTYDIEARLDAVIERMLLEYR